MHTHGKAFSTQPARAASTGQCNERWRAWPCNAMQPTCLHLVLVLQRPEKPAGCQGTFPTGRPAIFPLSLHGLCTGCSGKAPRPSALHKMLTGKATVHPIQAKRGRSVLPNIYLHCSSPALLLTVLIAFSLNYVDMLLLNSARRPFSSHHNSFYVHPPPPCQSFLCHPMAYITTL